MPRKTRKELASNPNLIPGIYNYCDRWCERCAFTSRCLTYQTLHKDDALDLDLNDAGFWEKLSETFAESKQMLVEMAEEQGLDLEAIANNKELDREIEEADAKAHNQPFVQAAEKYGFAVKQWMEAELSAANIGPEESFDEAITDALEVVQWYQFSIAVNLYGVYHLLEETNEDDDWQCQHNNGSIKVVLLAMDRSLLAWQRLQALLPRLASSIKSLMTKLEEIRSGVEAEFPAARQFIRPGFDEVTEYVM